MSKHRGSSFDDFLKEEGLLEEAEAEAAKRIFIFLLEKEMKKKRVSKAMLAQRLETSRMAVDRLLDPKAPSTLKSLAKAASALGKHLEISFCNKSIQARPYSRAKTATKRRQKPKPS